MSTKIYHGYRMTPRAFEGDFLPAFRAAAFEHARATLAAALGERPGHEGLRVLLSVAVAASRSRYRCEPLLIDAAVNAWLHRGRLYAIPYGEFLDGFESPRTAEDYAYWNNTDRPEGVAARAWAARRRTWDAVCLDDWDAGRLTHHAICARDGIGLHEVAKLLLPRDEAYRAVLGVHLRPIEPTPAGGEVVEVGG